MPRSFIAMLVGIALFLFPANPASAQTLFPFESADGLYGFRDSSNKILIQPQYFFAEPFSAHGIAAVADSSGWAYINAAGKVVIRPFIFDNGPDYFREGLARFVEGGKFGFFDQTGKVVVEPAFVFAGPFQEGRAPVCQGCKKIHKGEHWFMEGGLWGYIDRTGSVVIPFQFEEVSGFESKKARVRHKGELIWIDENGNVLK